MTKSYHPVTRFMSALMALALLLGLLSPEGAARERSRIWMRAATRGR
ncbi:hypothetical protein O9H85_09185 [Paenibacillus filicis]|uniref:Uncharacterized protein n=1 Tax=Paenibacillus gyeongsangnamensis TaxID=3388067 RepID=A0ABT4Q6T4_9BACL|nr:hypothetical protein [Paenibacillus filicis]MCZ8512582.1 hypothetical protein [Paenibacillus filicis]